MVYHIKFCKTTSKKKREKYNKENSFYRSRPKAIFELKKERHKRHCLKSTSEKEKKIFGTKQDKYKKIKHINLSRRSPTKDKSFY